MCLRSKSLTSAYRIKQIVVKVDELMELCDDLEEKLKQSQSTAESLASAVVAQLSNWNSAN
ncbi:MAG: hypothetical protein IIB00_03385 [candidate division Zixibacteria bacterium]|nr:hypothetical protein [candidate division Zixibacteria bacterium]